MAARALVHTGLMNLIIGASVVCGGPGGAWVLWILLQQVTVDYNCKLALKSRSDNA